MIKEDGSMQVAREVGEIFIAVKKFQSSLDRLEDAVITNKSKSTPVLRQEGSAKPSDKFPSDTSTPLGGELEGLINRLNVLTDILAETNERISL